METLLNYFFNLSVIFFNLIENLPSNDLNNTEKNYTHKLPS